MGNSPNTTDNSQDEFEAVGGMQVGCRRAPGASPGAGLAGRRLVGGEPVAEPAASGQV